MWWMMRNTRKMKNSTSNSGNQFSSRLRQVSIDNIDIKHVALNNIVHKIISIAAPIYMEYLVFSLQAFAVSSTTHLENVRFHD
jgi:hypothetical protein